MVVVSADCFLLPGLRRPLILPSSVAEAWELLLKLTDEDNLSHTCWLKKRSARTGRVRRSRSAIWIPKQLHIVCFHGQAAEGYRHEHLIPRKATSLWPSTSARQQAVWSPAFDSWRVHLHLWSLIKSLGAINGTSTMLHRTHFFVLSSEYFGNPWEPAARWRVQ